MRFRFSAEKLESFAVPGDSVRIAYDQDARQLGIRVQPSGKATYFLLKKITGKPYRRTLGDYPDLKLAAARELAHKLLSEVAYWLGRPPGERSEMNPMLRPSSDGRLSFKDAFELYLKAPLKDEARRFVDRKKADARRQYLFDHCFESLASKPVEEFTTIFVDAYHRKLEKKHGPVMANRGHEILRATFNHLIKKNLWTAVNPAAGATRAAKRERTRILEDDELKPFLDALDAEENKDLAEFLALLFSTGARKSNLYSAEWTELSLPMRTWTIPAEKYKNGKETVIKLSPQAVELFKRRKAAERKPDKRWVFPSKAKSKSGHTEDYKHQFARVKERACITKNLTFHDLRRSFVANLITSGVPMPIASEAAGHSNLASMGPYGRFAKGAVAKALDQGAADMKRRMDAAEAEKKLLSA